MNLERKHFIIGGSIIAVIVLGALTFFILNNEPIHMVALYLFFMIGIYCGIIDSNEFFRIN